MFDFRESICLKEIACKRDDPLNIFSRSDQSLREGAPDARAGAYANKRASGANRYSGRGDSE
jgi:hypothetical protein